MDAEQSWLVCREDYTAEFRRLCRAGILTTKQIQDMRYSGAIPDGPEFEKLKALRTRQLELWGKTERGRKEREEAAKESPIVAPPSMTEEQVDPLDDAVAAKLSALKRWYGPVDQLAGMVGTNVDHFLASFRRVHNRLEGVRAFESLGADETSLYVEVTPCES